ncbi:acyl-CoA dehydrogenase family protein [Leptospira kanakyensis]|uniref:Acyl-CoA dehydrogenase n=1 Tax=Leptospira kanakyensis TaxID=2484968 RepID=A0A6N4Q9Y8_9LEPT|nr:acyl-CoA dehydrogenase family protein [Leptospira kanakyensis]MCW7468985.1 acyl-CoA/acyl-ACP dehydrogenase [Leptospira kanakyensis]MCW7479972.1 acyl-CoA/acyl-ACP dehydrogenase [Leptospira kanakyensis]TGK50196.1 acyl-CoA dehydrogenase [Leptospira kanakyensis]TGK64203.1 acyl-CoA dehydrogenase [Leptospira kanakyensis]TGK69334.1 acyl-CoA dehydrogenase [Leptospira kanakyensis]
MTATAVKLEKSQAEKALSAQAALLNDVTKRLALKNSDNGKVSVSKMDKTQHVFYQLAWMTAQQRVAENFIVYAWDASKGTGEMEQKMALTFVAETVTNIRSELAARPAEYELTYQELFSKLFSDEINAYVEAASKMENYEAIVDKIVDLGHFGAYGLSEDHENFRGIFKDFAENVVVPQAEHVHRHDDLIPAEIINGLKDMGCFGLCIPEKFGGIQPDDRPDNISMLVVTEELSRGSLGAAGSLITRPEIMSKALLKGGTEEQKNKWLPLLASGEKFAGIMVTEPNYGSDVAGVSVTAKEANGGFVINGVKTWCTFAGYANLLLILCRTESDPNLKHKGLSIILAEKPSFDGHEFSYKQEGGGTIQGKAIGTIGYRGMHSYEVSFEDYFVPKENLLGGDAGRGKGFYFQMEGFAGGRIQTAARANGVMQAALEAALRYSQERKVFAKPIYDYTLTKFKIAKMAMIVQATRQYTNYVATLLDEHKGQMEATLVKLYASKIAEWVTREAMQIHGGMGYAEEYPVSRYFVDARVFSIFEGAEEVMALRVVAKDLLDQALAS